MHTLQCKAVKTTKCVTVKAVEYLMTRFAISYIDSFDTMGVKPSCLTHPRSIIYLRHNSFHAKLRWH